MKLYFATWIYEPGQQDVLNKKRAGNRLMSYYHLSDPKNKRSLKSYLLREKELSKEKN
jgi:hypothetical protein